VFMIRPGYRKACKAIQEWNLTNRVEIRVLRVCSQKGVAEPIAQQENVRSATIATLVLSRCATGRKDPIG
jgi:hypothetical protein